MPLPKINPIQTQAWKKLQEHYTLIKDVKMQELFAADASRGATFNVEWKDLYLDFSKTELLRKRYRSLQILPRK